MATPTVAGGVKLKLKLGDDASPEVFSIICGITTTNVSFDKAVNDVDLPDCADDDAISWLGREPQNRSVTITGDGVLDTTKLTTWRNWYDSDTAKNVQLWVDVASASGGGYWSGAFHLQSFQLGGQRGQKITVSGVNIVSDGAVTWTAAP